MNELGNQGSSRPQKPMEKWRVLRPKNMAYTPGSTNIAGWKMDPD